MVYRMRSGWYEQYVRPKCIRRVVITALLGTILLSWGLLANRQIASIAALCIFVVGIVDISGLRSAKSIIDLMEVVDSQHGLVFRFGKERTEVLYPWQSLVLIDTRRDGDDIESLVIEDSARRRSRLTVMGYENNGSFAFHDRSPRP